MNLPSPRLKKVTQKIILVIASVFFLAIFFFGYMIFIWESPVKQSCNRLSDVANDEEKIRYLKERTQKIINNNEILKGVGYLGYVEDRHEDIFSKLDMDWSYIGIDSRSAVFYMYRSRDDRDEYLSSSNIRSVGFGDGRNTIIIKINGGDSLENSGIKVIDGDQVIQVNREVFVLCSR